MADSKKSKEEQSPSTKSKYDCILPQTKVKTIMKSSPEVEQIGNDALFLITKCTEFFVAHLATRAYETGKVKTLQYKHLSDYVDKDESMLFLRDIIPAKMSARQALQEVAKQNAALNKEVIE